jgi:predicted transcriptional regulator
MDKKIQEMMTLLGCTEAEARQVLTDDKDIDKGQKKDFDLTPEQLKVAKHRGQRAPRVYTHTKRERKENPTKVEIIQALFEFLTEKGYENLNITKKEREIDFTRDGNNYTLQLVQHRQPKK